MTRYENRVIKVTLSQIKVPLSISKELSHLSVRPKFSSSLPLKICLDSLNLNFLPLWWKLRAKNDENLGLPLIWLSLLTLVGNCTFPHPKPLAVYPCLYFEKAWPHQVSLLATGPLWQILTWRKMKYWIGRLFLIIKVNIGI